MVGLAPKNAMCLHYLPLPNELNEHFLPVLRSADLAANRACSYLFRLRIPACYRSSRLAVELVVTVREDQCLGRENAQPLFLLTREYEVGVHISGDHLLSKVQRQTK